MKKTLVPVLLTLLAAPTTAHAASRLTQDRADAAAAEEIAVNIQAGVEDGPDDESVPMTAADLDPCEITGTRRADCAATFYFSDGDACDALLEVRVTRRGRVTVQTSIEYCDSDD
jgi:hypothetical protein